MTDTPTGRARELLDHWLRKAKQSSLNVYLVVDGAWQPDFVQAIRQRDEGWQPLFGWPNEPKRDAHQASPLLVDLFVRPEVIDPWLAGGFLDRLGIVLVSPLSIEEQRTSLKRFQQLALEDETRPIYLRFYDARVLYCFLTSGFTRQWADFFGPVRMIAAPSDHSLSFALYEVVDGELVVGLERDADVGLEFQAVESGDRADPQYDASLPFRRLTRRQNEAMEACVRRLFHVEITNFLFRAFPDEAEKKGYETTLLDVADAQLQAEQRGYGSEDASFYWCVLSFVGGVDFAADPDVEKWLKVTWLDNDTKLKRLLDTLNESWGNQHVLDLIDTDETVAEYADGRYIRWRTKSGKVLEHRPPR